MHFEQLGHQLFGFLSHAQGVERLDVHVEFAGLVDLLGPWILAPLPHGEGGRGRST